ncbi:MAG: hypothetical protein LBS48_06960 [Treponema sp.]|jgi:hypothetical protein|nr:hypothetical protein [Treponema sp.]
MINTTNPFGNNAWDTAEACRQGMEITGRTLRRAAASGEPLPAPTGEPPLLGSGRAGVRGVAIPGTTERGVNDTGKSKTTGRARERQILGGRYD